MNSTPIHECNATTTPAATIFASTIKAQESNPLQLSTDANPATELNGGTAQKTSDIARGGGRAICSTCHRPTPQACICAGLPTQLVNLQNCRLLVLQHPHESKRKNRSLPLIDMCLSQDCIHTIIGRRLYPVDHPRYNEAEWRRHHFDVPEEWLGASNPVLLLYPDSEKAVSLQESLERIHTLQPNKRITILTLDATWKFAAEIHRKHLANDCYPDHMISVALKPEDFKVHRETEGEEEKYRPRRFDIRTPPNEDCLSTAEAIAWVVSRVEEKEELFDIFMKPLDLMVAKWNAFINSKT